MVIGIDIDGVITDMYGYVNKARRKFNKENNIKTPKNKSAYLFYEYFGWNRQESDKFWDEIIWDYAQNVKFYKSASKYIKKLREDGHIIYIVTKRHFLSHDNENGKKMQELIIKQFKENAIQYDKILAVETSKTKVNSILENSVSVMIDDEVRNIEEISHHIPTICYTTKYNKSYKVSNSNMHRCKNWKEIYLYINSLKQET